MQTAKGTWRTFGVGGSLEFSKEFLVVDGQDLSGNGSVYGSLRKELGVLPVAIELEHRHVLWYGRQDTATWGLIAGHYSGDEDNCTSSLDMRADQTFEQSVTINNKTIQSKGKWWVDQAGDIFFSKDFLLSIGRPLSADETASAKNPMGSSMQIEISVSSPLGTPVFLKSLVNW